MKLSSSTVASTRFSTLQFDAWRDSIDVVYDVQRPASDEGTPFSADVDAFQLDDVVVTTACLDEQRYIRSAARVRRDGMDQFVFNLYRTGGWRSRTSRGDFAGAQGQVCVIDLACELVTHEPRSELVALFVPRSLLEDRLPDLTLLHGSAPTGPHSTLLAEYLDLLARQLPTLPAGNEQALSQAVCEMLAACIAPSLAGLDAARAGLELVLRHRARRYIEKNLGLADLGPEAICNAVGISRRALYRLFEPEGGVQHYVQTRRLQRIRTALLDPRETRRISELAAAFGFARSDHFARAFKQQFGQSARDVRSAAHRGPPTGPHSPLSGCGEHHGFQDWIRALHA